MSLFCPDKHCKSAKGACAHEKWLLSAVVIAGGIFALAKTLNWF